MATADTSLTADDCALLNALLEDGRASVDALCDATGIPAHTVTERLAHLEETGVIEGYRPTVDYAALGYDVTAIVRLDVADDCHDAAVDAVTAADGVADVYEVTGAHDVVAVVRFTDTDAMGRYLASLLASESVRSASASVVRDTVCEHEQFRLAPDAE